MADLDVADFMSDDEIDEEDDLEHLPLETQHSKVVLLTDVPRGVPIEKIPKLRATLEKICSKFGKLDAEAEVVLDPKTNASAGFAFVPFQQPAQAAACSKALKNGMKMGKNLLKARPYTDLRKYLEWPDEMEQKEEESELDDPRAWLADESGLDQFVLRYGRETNIMACEGPSLKCETKMVYDGSEQSKNGRVWCDRYVMWSPKGTYLATFHPRGVALWQGVKFQRPEHGRLEHPQVVEAAFSPDEKFLVTWDEVVLKVWETSTGIEVKTIETPNSAQMEWPILQFSHDDSLMARSIRDGISVWDTSTMALLEGSSIVAKNVVSFQWSPAKRNVLAYWAPESEAQPARVVILNPVSREEVRSKNLVAVSNIRLHWHPNGDFLCAQVLRHTKSRKTNFTNFEFFRLNEPGIPNERLEERARVETLAFEPNGTRLAVVKGDSEHRSDVVFYDMTAEDGVVELFEITNRPWNTVVWSPVGNHCVLVAAGNVNGAMEFVDVDAKRPLKTGEHFGANGVRWDPSGRIVASMCVVPLNKQASGVKSMNTPGYKLWSAMGDKLKEEDVEALFQFAWRPRPPTMLTKKEIASVEKTLGRIARKYEKEDKLRRKRLDAAENAEKVDALVRFRDMLEYFRRSFFLSEEKQREEMGVDKLENDDEDLSTEDYEMIESVVEELVSEKVETI